MNSLGKNKKKDLHVEWTFGVCVEVRTLQTIPKSSKYKSIASRTIKIQRLDKMSRQSHAHISLYAATVLNIFISIGFAN